MKQVFKTALYISLFINMLACSSIDRRANIVEEKVVVSQEKEMADKARMGVLRTKQSLRIALLELNLQARPGQTVILDSRAASLYSKEVIVRLQGEGKKPSWSPNQLAVLHSKILPELYALLNTVERKGLPLLVLCYQSIDCEVLKQNMGPKLKQLTKFVHKNFSTYLRRVIPLLTIATSPGLFDRLGEETVAWENWKDSWFQIHKKNELSPDQWSALLPSVNEF